MKALRSFGMVGLLSLATLSSAAPNKLAANPDVMVVADALGDMPAHLQPTAGKPVYYTFSGGSQLTVGESVGGIKMPNAGYVTAAAELALKSQGFERATDGGPAPALSIRLYWGDANFWLADQGLGSDALFGPIRYSLKDVWMHRYLLGWHKRGALSLTERTRFGHTMQDDVLFVLVSAFEAKRDGAPAGRPLWTTSMSIDGRNSLREELPVMLTSAAPYFGRSIVKPTFIDDRDRRDTNVQIGSPTVVAYDVPSQGAASPGALRELKAVTTVWMPKSR